jgi:hypothetical protein
MSRLRQVLDSRGREVLELDDPDLVLEVLVRLARGTDAAAEELVRCGLELHSRTGVVASGVVTAGNLRRLVEIPEVTRVEVSRELHKENESGG